MLKTDPRQIMVSRVQPEDPQPGHDATLLLVNTDGKELVELGVAISTVTPARGQENMFEYISGQVQNMEVYQLVPFLVAGEPTGPIYFTMKFNVQTGMADLIQFDTETFDGFQLKDLDEIT